MKTVEEIYEERLEVMDKIMRYRQKQIDIERGIMKRLLAEGRTDCLEVKWGKLLNYGKIYKVERPGDVEEDWTPKKT